MDGWLRTFVALRVGAAVSAALRREARRLAGLDAALRTPASDDFHLTLRFLGDTRPEEVPAISRALAEAAAGSGPIAVRYVGLGAFPTPQRARVVWVGVEEADPGGGPDGLRRLARAVGEGLDAVGAPGGPAEEAGRLRPHVTLGRLRQRPGEALVRALREDARRDLGGEVLSDLRLILSRPGPGRYSYSDLTTVVLGRAGEAEGGPR